MVLERRVAAVIFDLDGVLLDSETTWDAARREVVRREGGTWSERATRDMMGMSAPEWSTYLHDRLDVPLSPPEISSAVVQIVVDAYERDLPLLPHAREAVRALAARWPLGLASSSNRVVIDRVLEASSLRGSFAATVSSEEVANGKPDPAVYLEAARRLDTPPEGCVAIEDSTNGIRSAAAARTVVIAVPNAHYPPSEDALHLAAAVITGLDHLTERFVVEVFESHARRATM
jgi:HAD superfamily hydrolase (TIGR01509 family)